MLLHISLALLLQADPLSQLSQSRLGAISNNEARTDAAGYSVIRFLQTWRTAWIASDGWRGLAPTDIRLRDVHCHWDGSYGNSGARGHARPPSLIHRSSRRSMCPDWFPSGERAPGDERVERDVSLAPMWRSRVRAARASLLDSLALFDRQHPGDAWITGERVRFLVDQGEPAAALEVAQACTANRVWCAQLAGFALDAAGKFARADSAFDAASMLMSPKERCEWTSAAFLLDPDGRSAYEHLTCEERAAANKTLWWLSTPLFADSVDDRRSEDFSRKVLVQLHAALPWDERFDWRGRYGGEAVSEMLVRYGWPAFSVWTGQMEEESHAGWMSFYDSTRTATLEYPEDRLHLVPDWRAIADAFHAPPDAWQINMPVLKADDEPAAQWWPSEHYARARGPIVQLPTQTVMLRRDSDVLLATASDLRSLGRDAYVDSMTPVLVRTTQPGSVDKVRHQTFRNETAIVLTAHVAAKPAVVGTEMLAARAGELSARTRMGVVPPMPLDALRPGETALSDPVLIAADDATPPPGPDRALQQMLGSTDVRGAKVGIYWETYGYEAADSVDVAVVITRREKLSTMRRIGMKLHLAHDLNGSVAVRWGEPQPGHSSWNIPGVVPIQARSVRLDLSRLEPGHYSVEVQVGRKGGVPVTASRNFVYEGM